MTRASAREAIARADGADSLIETALDIADRGLENARRTGFGSMVSGGYRDAWHMAALREARRHYARTGDSEGDLLRALSLAHEAERCATEGAIADRSFNQWLRRNGHRLGM